MSDLLNELKPLFSRRIVFIGIGNTMKQDDAIGVMVVDKLKEHKLQKHIKLIDAGAVPENYIEPIRNFNPETLIILDAVYSDSSPGAIKVYSEEHLGFYGFSTHSMSPKLFILALKKENNKPACFLLGIQPKSLNFGQEMTDEIKRAGECLLHKILQILNGR